MEATIFIDHYKVSDDVCDRIIAFYEANERLAQPGRPREGTATGSA